MQTQLPLWETKTPNPLEMAAVDLLHQQGYEVVHYGWPDFAGWNREKGKVVFTEIKPFGKKLNKNQRRMKRIFNEGGLDYLVWWVKGNHEVIKSPESD
jgi:hypothetical protein